MFGEILVIIPLFLIYYGPLVYIALRIVRDMIT